METKEGIAIIGDFRTLNLRKAAWLQSLLVLLYIADGNAKTIKLL